MLPVLDQVAAVEALPPIPTVAAGRRKGKRAGTNGKHKASSVSDAPPELARIISLWSQLPDDRKASILETIGAGTRG